MSALPQNVIRIDETRQYREMAARVAGPRQPPAGSPKPVAEAEAWLDDILAAGEQKLPARAVQALPHLCFPLEGTADPRGLCFVLWEPVVRIIREGFTVEVEEWLCNGEVAVVYLNRDAANFARALCPHIEELRPKNPFPVSSDAFRIVLKMLRAITPILGRSRPDVADIVEQILPRLHDRLDRLEAEPRQAGSPGIELLAAARGAPPWAVETCIALLRSAVRAEEPAPGACAFASEASLAKDWLHPEEDEAWKNL